MDVWVNFKNATKWQAEGIFKCFFPSRAGSSTASSSAQDASQKNLPISKRRASSQAIPLLADSELAELAKRFADAIPEDELSVGRIRPHLRSL